MKAAEVTVGPLRCVEAEHDTQSNSAPTHLVVLCHGFGASCMDLAGLADPWLRVLGDDAHRVRFLFPNAPMSLANQGMPGGFAWWPLNMARLMQAIQADSFEELHAETPPGIAEATEALGQTVAAAIESIEAAAGSPPQLSIGGFSQGAMVTMNGTVMQEWVKPHTLLQFSGTLISKEIWQQKADQALAGVDVYQSHGRQDPILPYSGAERLQELIQSTPAKSQFYSFEGPHTIHPETISHVGHRLAKWVQQS